MIAAVPVASLERRRRLVRLREAAAVFMSWRRACKVADELIQYAPLDRAETFELASETIAAHQRRDGLRLQYCDDPRVAAARIANAWHA